ncbi:hypothetical protein SAMN05216189_10585 [Pseudomonas delhiensis]|uniref:Uncharacterized protein n=1 Tax=Pseudomonas delhiensis TaxID=366289 RepID=A0A239NIV9_9PSED|nr:hypothetical protein [Pseudomonas delhiensis]SDK91583.1 hypothetical protein SAMN05216189_10585 [Pseudomonas delhiensis]SNT54258.1 hypothetical protein SAMN06295949_1474 [Pseudomonas delhiensis]
MNLERRSLLKGMALGSLAGMTLGGPGLALARNIGGAAATQPALVLVAPAVVGSAFLQGIAASPAGAHAEVLRSDASLAFVRELQRRLETGRPQRIVGLLDDASAALVVDLARSAGARVQWLGEHSADARASRHRLITADAAHGHALQLGLQLDACGAGFDLREQCPLGSRQPLRLGAATRSAGSAEQWATTLGYGLAALGEREPAPAPLVAGHPSPLAGHFVSFSIQA